jgi:hypothetical protein
MQGVVFVLFVIIVVGVVILGAYQAAQRRKELMLWARSKGLRYTRAKDHRMDQRFPHFNCLKQGTNRYAYNIMEGDWSGRPIIAFDYHYETRSSNSKGGSQTHHHHFSAVIVRSHHLLKPLFIRPEHFFDRITEFFGLDDIDFESAEFSRKFFVKAKDKRWAYDVIHARTMQFLLDMPQFTIQFDPVHAIANRSARLRTSEFETAAKVVHGILDRFPDYLVKQLKEQG